MENVISHRKRARALAGLPEISIARIGVHFNMDPDTARKILRSNGIKPVPSPHGHPRYSWVDIWRLTQIPESLILDPSFHDELMEPLQTAGDLAAIHECTPTTIRNWVRQKKLPAIKLGHLFRFRILREREEDCVAEEGFEQRKGAA